MSKRCRTCEYMLPLDAFNSIGRNSRKTFYDCKACLGRLLKGDRDTVDPTHVNVTEVKPKAVKERAQNFRLPVSFTSRAHLPCRSCNP